MAHNPFDLRESNLTSDHQAVLDPQNDLSTNEGRPWRSKKVVGLHNISEGRIFLRDNSKSYVRWKWCKNVLIKRSLVPPLYNTERALHLLRISCLRNVRSVQISGKLPWDNWSVLAPAYIWRDKPRVCKSPEVPRQQLSASRYYPWCGKIDAGKVKIRSHALLNSRDYFLFKTPLPRSAWVAIFSQHK